MTIIIIIIIRIRIREAPSCWISLSHLLARAPDDQPKLPITNWSVTWNLIFRFLSSRANEKTEIENQKKKRRKKPTATGGNTILNTFIWNKFCLVIWCCVRVHGACDPFWLPETKNKQTAISTDNIIPDPSSARINCLFYPLGCPIMTYKNQIPCSFILFCLVIRRSLFKHHHWKCIAHTV